LRDYPLTHTSSLITRDGVREKYADSEKIAVEDMAAKHLCVAAWGFFY
jgi:hypothetical protein